MRVLITGATGLFGMTCVKLLKARYEVMGCARHPACHWDTRLASFNVCDITQREQVDYVVSEFRPHVIVHSAAMPDVDFCERNPQIAFQVNAHGTENVARAASESGSRLIFIGTDYVFDGQSDQPYCEDDLTGPVNTYGRSKLRAEAFVRKHVVDHLIIRTSWLFNEKGNSFIRMILDKSREAGPLPVIADKFSTPTDIHEVVKVLQDAISDEKSLYRGTFHLTNEGRCSWYEFAQCVLEAQGCESRLQLIPISQKEANRHATRPRMSVLSSRKYQNVSGSSFRPWQDAVRECVSTQSMYERPVCESKN